MPLTLSAQQAPSGYHTVACFKVKPGQNAEFQKWFPENSHKLQQANADSGRISAWFLLSAVMPQGKAAECDYYSVSVYPGLPPAPLGMEALGATLKKAGIPMSTQEFAEKRASLVDMVSWALWRNQVAVGSFQKGDYLFLNRMKVANLAEWIALEKKIWQPLAEQWVKDGDMHGWFLNVAVLPGGTDLKYQAATVDVCPNWEAAMKYPVNAADTFKKVHPDKDMAHTFEYLKLRDLAVRELLNVQDVVIPAK